MYLEIPHVLPAESRLEVSGSRPDSANYRMGLVISEGDLGSLLVHTSPNFPLHHFVAERNLVAQQSDRA